MMMKFPAIRPLDSKITDYFASADQNLSIPLIQVPTEEGLSLPYLCPSLTSPDGKLLVLGVHQERTILGRGLVRGLWFGREGRIWLPSPGPGQSSLALTVLPYRCLIAGPVFTQLLKQARSRDPLEDFAAVWELAVQNVEERDDFPQGVPEESPDGEPEYHLDHPSLRA